MKALLKKDTGWIALFAALGTFFSTMVVYDRNFIYFWVWPESVYSVSRDLFMLWMISGLVLGSFAAVNEELTRTTEYLRHRPVSRGKIFATKTLACLGLVTAWILVPLICHRLFPGLWHEQAFMADWSRFWVYAGTGAVAFSSFSAAFFAVSLRLDWIKRLAIGAAAVIGLTALSFALSRLFGGWAHSSMTAYLLVHGGFTVLFIWGAYRNSMTARDADHPISNRTLGVSGTLSAVLLIMVAGYAFAYVQNSLHLDLTQTYPSILVPREGESRLARVDYRKDPWRFVPVNDQHQDVKDPDPALEEMVARDDTYQFHPFSPPDFTGMTAQEIRFWTLSTRVDIWNPGVEIGGFSSFYLPVLRLHWWDTFFLKKPEGMIYRYDTTPRAESTSPRCIVMGKGADQEPFSKDAVNMAEHFKKRVGRELQSTGMIGDPSDGGIWIYDLEKDIGHFERLELPGGDRFKDIAIIKHLKDRFDIQEQIEVEGQQYAVMGLFYDFAVRGDRGTYLWNGTGFENGPDWLHEEVQRMNGLALKINEIDPLSFSAEVRNGADEVLLSHDYAPRGGKARFKSGLIHFCSLLRAPIAQAIGFLLPAESMCDRFNTSAFIDPLVTSGKRIWLVLAAWIVAGVLAWRAAKRLALFGAPGHRRIYWFVFILLGGLGVYLVYRFMETQRAYRVQERVKPEEAPEMLIFSEKRAAVP